MLHRLFRANPVLLSGIAAALVIAAHAAVDATIGLPRTTPPPGITAPPSALVAVIAAFSVGFIRRVLLALLRTPVSRNANLAAWSHEAAAGTAGALWALVDQTSPAAAYGIVATAHLALTPLVALWLSRLAATEPERRGSESAGSHRQWIARPLVIVALGLGAALWAPPLPFAYGAGGDPVYFTEPRLYTALPWQPILLFDVAMLAGLATWCFLAIGLVVVSPWVEREGLRALHVFYGSVAVLVVGIVLGLWSGGGLVPGPGAFLFASIGPVAFGVYRVGVALGAYPPRHTSAESGRAPEGELGAG